MSITGHDTLADFSQDKRLILLSILAFIIGIFSTITAYLLVSLIALITNVVFFQKISTVMTSLIHHHLGGWVILVPVLGGLIIGLMARFGSEKIRGHGIPEALEAILFGRSKMSLKVAILKPLSSAISIGTGGPFGAEGPIIMTGGAIGSLFAQLFHLSAAERKTLLVAGAAGGMAAIFVAPIAAVLLAVELLLFEWRPRSFIPVAIAATVAGALRVPIMGPGPIFTVLPHHILGIDALGFAAIVGLFAGLASGLLTTLVYTFEDLFEKLPCHWMWWPAIGGLFVGIGGFIDPRVLGVGYDNIQSLLSGHLFGVLALSLLVGKAIVWSLSLGSGTSGGVLAPLLIIGGALGAFESGLIPIGDAGLWAMISMAAMMGGTMRSPLTAMIFALELTHDINVLPALLVGCVVAHMITVLLLRRSILTEKVARRGFHISREYGVDPLSTIRIADVMDKNIPTISSAVTLRAYSEQLMVNAPTLYGHHCAFIFDNKQLIGLITRADLLRAIDNNLDLESSIMSIAVCEIITAYPDEILSDVLQRMLQNNIGRVPVLDRSTDEVVGYLGRTAILQAQIIKLREETIRESVWSFNNT